MLVFLVVTVWRLRLVDDPAGDTLLFESEIFPVMDWLLESVLVVGAEGLPDVLESLVSVVGFVSG